MRGQESWSIKVETARDAMYQAKVFSVSALFYDIIGWYDVDSLIKSLDKSDCMRLPN